MALAGIRSVIPPDEVVEAMYKVGRAMPQIFKETAEGGVATTPTGLRLQKPSLWRTRKGYRLKVIKMQLIASQLLLVISSILREF